MNGLNKHLGADGIRLHTLAQQIVRLRLLVRVNSRLVDAVQGSSMLSRSLP